MLAKMHPSNVIRGCAIKLRDVLYFSRLWGKVRFADVAEDQAEQIRLLCEAISREICELETVSARAAEDRIFTPEELDDIIQCLRNIRDEAEEGRAK